MQEVVLVLKIKTLSTSEIESNKSTFHGELTDIEEDKLALYLLFKILKGQKNN